MTNIFAHVNNMFAKNVHIYDLEQHRDVYYADINAHIKVYNDTVVITDLTNAMQRGKTCKEYTIYANPWRMDETGLSLSEIVELMTPECDTIAELMQAIRQKEGIHEVCGSSLSIKEVQATRIFSPFYTPKQAKLGETLTATTITRAIIAGKISSVKTTARYTDDYALDAAENFYQGEVDLQNFAREIYEDPKGWSFYWGDSHKEIHAAHYHFDYKTLTLNPA